MALAGGVDSNYMIRKIFFHFPSNQTDCFRNLFTYLELLYVSLKKIINQLLPVETCFFHPFVSCGKAAFDNCGIHIGILILM